MTAERERRARLAIAEQSYFWLGVSRTSVPAWGTITAMEQMYVEYQVPMEITRPYPIVCVHGGGGQGLDYLTTADGRPGWATGMLQAGFPTYVVDRPGLGRSPYHPDLLGPMGPPPTYDLIRRIGALDDPGFTQWPGSWDDDDPALAHFMAEQGPSIPDLERTHRLFRERGAELLDRIGPSVLVTHSAGGPFGWLVADARPDLVKAIVAVEPAGPAFSAFGAGPGLQWGITASPMTFDPPAGTPEELARADVALGGGTATIQAEPARTLPNLRGIPIVLVIAECSPARAVRSPGIIAFLRQAGATVDELRLWEHGIHGNGHFMMCERNSDEILELVLEWIDKNVGTSRP